MCFVEILADPHACTIPSADVQRSSSLFPCRIHALHQKLAEVLYILLVGRILSEALYPHFNNLLHIIRLCKVQLLSFLRSPLLERRVLRELGLRMGLPGILTSLSLYILDEFRYYILAFSRYPHHLVGVHPKHCHLLAKPGELSQVLKINTQSDWAVQSNYLSHHPWQQEVIQSFFPTILVYFLAILIPLILLLVARKAYRMTTLSLIHDTILICYYKFLIVNVSVFFCVGIAALQSFLTSFGKVSESNILGVMADSFPSAGPFYVGWSTFSPLCYSSVCGC